MQKEMTITEALARFNPRQVQLLLGTLLGDGCLTKGSDISARYRGQHGAVQHEYNKIKHVIMEEFTSAPPKITTNYGYGEESSVWSTLSYPELKVVYDFCYPNGKKTVTKEWLNLVDWEGMAWWHMDDGTLGYTKRHVVISTHGFSEQEVHLIADWLISKGVRARASRVKKGEKSFHVIYMGVKGSRVFLEKIRPFVPECMAYKVAFKDLYCKECGSLILRMKNANTCSEECAKTRSKELKRVYNLRYQSRRNELARVNYQKNRAYILARGKAWREANKESFKEWHSNYRKAWRQSKKGDPVYEDKLRKERDAYYQRVKQDPSRMEHRREVRRQWIKTPEIKAQRKAELDQWRKDNPEKYEAQRERARLKRQERAQAGKAH